MTTTIDELKALMLAIGMDNELVQGMDPDRLLAHQGVDSLDCPAFSVAVEQRYGINISDADALRLKTLNDFVNHIEAGR